MKSPSDFQGSAAFSVSTGMNRFSNCWKECGYPQFRIKIAMMWHQKEKTQKHLTPKLPTKRTCKRLQPANAPCKGAGSQASPSKVVGSSSIASKPKNHIETLSTLASLSMLALEQGKNPKRTLRKRIKSMPNNATPCCNIKTSTSNATRCNNLRFRPTQSMWMLPMGLNQKKLQRAAIEHPLAK